MDALNRIATAAEALDRHEKQAGVARAELHAAIREAAAHGVSQAVISRVSGYSRERVRQLSKPAP